MNPVAKRRYLERCVRQYRQLEAMSGTLPPRYLPTLDLAVVVGRKAVLEERMADLRRQLRASGG